MENLSNIRPKHHTNYAKCSNQEGIETVFRILKSPSRLQHGTMMEINYKLNILINTPKTWRKKLLLQPQTKLIEHGEPGKSRILTDKKEEEIFEKIDDQFKKIFIC